MRRLHTPHETLGCDDIDGLNPTRPSHSNVGTKLLLVLLRLSSPEGFSNHEPGKESLSTAFHAATIYDRCV